MTEDEYLKLSRLSEEELLYGLGRSLSDGRLGVGPSDYIEKAKAWLEARRPDICRWLAEKPVTRQLIEDGEAARQMEGLGALLDMWALANSKTSAGWAAVFILRVGIADFCAGCEIS